MEVKVTLTDNEIHSILRTASTACSYWASSDDPLTEALRRPVTVYADKVQVHEVDRKQTFPLSIAMLRGAATHMVTLMRQGKCSKLAVQQLLFDPASVDAPTADIFVQVAIFGRIVFG